MIEAVPPQAPVEAKEDPVVAFVIGDPHFHTEDIELSNQMAAATVAEARRIKPSVIVCLGDVVHTHDVVRITPHVHSTEWLGELSDIAPTVLMIGNHDRRNNSDYQTKYHPFSACKRWPNFTVIDTATSMMIKGKQFTFVPYVPPGRFAEALTSDKTFDSKVPLAAIFAHQEFKGAQMGAVKSVKGDVWPETAPLVISGHIHQYQRLQPNLHYVGTPRQVGYGDTLDKSISVYTFGKTVNDISDVRIKLNLPVKKSLRMTAAEAAQYVPEPGAQIRLKISGTEGEIKTFKQTAEARLRSAGVAILYALTATEMKSVNSAVTPLRAENFTQLLYSRVSTQNPQLLPYLQQLWGNLIPIPNGVGGCYATQENTQAGTVQPVLLPICQPLSRGGFGGK